MSKTMYSDEQLEAFIDDEINLSERAAFMEALEQDGELANRVCELLHVKDTVKLAYRESPQSSHPDARLKKRRRNSIVSRAIAATLFFTLGALSGLAMQSQSGSAHPESPLASNANLPAENEYRHIIFHISTSDPARLGRALDDAEALLTSYENKPELVQLEVIANTEGLSLLRRDTSPYVDRIRTIFQTHNNVSFLACSRTIEKLRLKGIDVHLIPEATVIPGALEQIVDRLQQGWVYIRV